MLKRLKLSSSDIFALASFIITILFGYLGIHLSQASLSETVSKKAKKSKDLIVCLNMKEFKQKLIQKLFQKQTIT